MTVFGPRVSASFGNPTPAEVMTSYGTPVPEVSRREAPSGEIAKDGATYGASIDLNPSPRELTQREAAILLPEVVRKFSIEHPEAVVRYADIRRGSPQSCVVQFTTYERSPLPSLAVIVGWLILAAIAVAAVVIFAVFVAPMLKVVWEVIAAPVPQPVIWLVYLIPIAIVGYLAYRFIVKPMMVKKEEEVERKEQLERLKRLKEEIK